METETVSWMETEPSESGSSSDQVIWIVRGEQDLVQVTRKLEMPEGRLYAWVATESALSRKVRAVLLNEFGLDEGAVKAAGYWRLDSSEE